MLCRICKQTEASVHLTQIMGEAMQTMDLCEECARAKGVNDPTGFSLAELLSTMGGPQRIQPPGESGEIHL
jgi:protein arginine kinase activator